MELYYADVRGIDENQYIYKARSQRRGSAFSVLLLAYAVRDVCGISLPDISEDGSGKPYFPDAIDLHFSISHSRGHILCAVSDSPVGVDIEQRRALRPGFAERMCSPEELRDFNFFDLWTLRESYFKLTGTGDLRSLYFSRNEDEIISPSPRVYCRVYSSILNCSVAACSFDVGFPGSIVTVSPELFLT